MKKILDLFLAPQSVASHWFPQFYVALSQRYAKDTIGSIGMYALVCNQDLCLFAPGMNRAESKKPPSPWALWAVTSRTLSVWIFATQGPSDSILKHHIAGSSSYSRIEHDTCARMLDLMLNSAAIDWSNGAMQQNNMYKTHQKLTAPLRWAQTHQIEGTLAWAGLESPGQDMRKPRSGWFHVCEPACALSNSLDWSAPARICQTCPGKVSMLRLSCRFVKERFEGPLQGRPCNLQDSLGNVAACCRKECKSFGWITGRLNQVHIFSNQNKY